MQLDFKTLLALACIIYIALALLMLTAAFYGERDRALIYVGIGWLINGAMGVIINNWLALTYWHALMIWVPNTAILFSYGLIWAALSRFGRIRRIAWPVAIAGAVSWLLLCLWPAFTQNLYLRVLAFSIIVLIYMMLSVHALWPLWRRGNPACTPVFVIMVLNTAFYAYRVIPKPTNGALWIMRADMATTVVESILFSIGFSFTLLIMVRARTEQRYHYASHHDALTRLQNRRALFKHGQQLFAQAQMFHRQLAALMLDLDHFKQVNDRYGHDVGDQVLSLFAKVLKHQTPDDVICARLGGEEFVLLIPDTAHAQLLALSQDIRHHFTQASKDLVPTATVSIGISRYSDADASLDRLLVRADQALYAAKSAGRDRVCVWTQNHAHKATYTQTARQTPST